MGFADKRVVFGGAPPGTPWGTLAAITAAALAKHGYEVRIEPEASRGRCPGLVSAGKLDFGATQAILVRWAFAGLHRYVDGGPYPRLRALATIMHPAWLAVAARVDSGITSLEQVRQNRLPVRVVGGTGDMFRPILDYYGLSRQLIDAWGGRFISSQDIATVRTGNFDLILENAYTAYTPEIAALVEASVLFNLRFLELQKDLIDAICQDYGGTPGAIPYRLLRGVEAPVPSVYRPWQLIFARNDMPDDFAYLLAKSYDDQRDLFRQTHIPFSYDSHEVARDHGIPLHPGAERYYRDQCYL